MAGTPQPGPQPALTPYGHQAAHPMPAFNPQAGMKRPGETACKVWGIILLIFALLGLANLLGSIAMMTGGFSGSSFMPMLSPDAKAEYDRLIAEMIDASLARPSFWINTVGEVVVALLSLAAGIFLVVRPKPRGAKLALARAALVLLLLPAYGYETVRAIEGSGEAQVRMMELQSKGSPPPPGFTDMFSRIMTGISYGTVIFVVAVVVAINGVLAYQMTRPQVAEYLASAGTQPAVIPGYDPSMGLIGPPGGVPFSGAAPPGGFPSQTQVPPPQS